MRHSDAAASNDPRSLRAGLRPALRAAAAALALGVVAFVTASLAAGTALLRPNPSVVGEAPPDLHAETVRFQSESGAAVVGWFSRGRPGAGVVVLLHGLHGSRASMIGRARFLGREGFSTLAIDLQASGESGGSHPTFGYLESRDARAAVDWARAACPGERVGVVGVSLGAASIALADPPLEADALVLEEVYSTIENAIDDRLAIRFGSAGKLLRPALTVQIAPRLGIDASALRPLDRVAEIAAPKLFLAGSDDADTTLHESREIFACAAEPKQLWVVDGAGHVDLHAFAREEYERRVGGFLRERLR